MIDTNETRDDSTERRAETHHVHYDPTADERPSEMLVIAVADIADADPLELEPLFETVDPDTLNDFVGTDGLPEVGGHISFRYAGHDVTVYPSGLLEIEPAS
ncbi:HalOD1 output domain-containing protein [Halorussus caseinilyticus]|uniref:HalOD1 output domain-containing protein n=1 Tax=Halorussus caseinilyticus TaxID=3034025 RepID=A0ABD5WIU5_9EURY|nr:HalOD1 output domain-containing protein [Halorussus sp. DT72]